MINTDIYNIIAQLIGIAAVTMSFFILQGKTQLRIILFNLATALTFALHYFMLSATTGVVLNIVIAIISLGFAYRNKKQIKSPSGIIISCIVIVIAGLWSWDNIYSLFVILGLVLDMVSLSFYNPQKTRFLMVIKSPMCLTYNIAVFSIGGIISETIVLVSALIGLYRYRNTKAE